MDFLKEFLVELLTSEKTLIDTLAIVFILTMIISYPFVSKFYDKKKIEIRKNDFNSFHHREDKLFCSIVIGLCVDAILCAFINYPLNMLYLEEKTSIKSEKIYEQGKDYAFHIKDNNVFFLNDDVIVRKIEDHSKFNRRLKNMSGVALSFDKDFMNNYEQNGLSEEIVYQTEISRLTDDYDRSSIKIVDKRKSRNVVKSNRLIVKEIEYVRTLFGKEIETKSELQIKQIIE